MPFLENYRDVMDQRGPDLSVVDVYDMASEIGKEFEKMIDQHGLEAVTNLMPRVICALEYLETFAANGEQENSHIRELQTTIHQLETEKVEKAEYRQRFETELEQIEDAWRNEKREMLSLVSRLQEENKRLSVALNEKEGNPLPCACGHEQDLQAIQRLRSVVENNQDQIRKKDREIREKSIELEQLQSKVENLSTVNRDLVRKHKGSQGQMRVSMEEKAEMQAQLQTQQRILQQLRQRLGMARKENEDLNKPSPGDVPDLRNKVVYDLDDPERPRFTLLELKNILYERNELKAKCSEQEDELAMYKPKPSTPESCNGEEELPVQGPINKDPDDAPWKKQDSGIRKLFRRLFGDSVETTRSPWQSLGRARFSMSSSDSQLDFQ